MRKLFFDTIKTFVEEITENHDSVISEDENISIIAKYEEAREIIKELMFYDWNLRDIKLIDNLYGDYNDEYVISLSSISEDYEVWCEPMNRENGYLDIESLLVYILDNCSSKVIPHCNGEVINEVTIGECCEPLCDECCGLCNCNDEELCVNEDDDMHGFSVNRSDENSHYFYSFYSTDRKLVEEMAKEFR